MKFLRIPNSLLISFEFFFFPFSIIFYCLNTFARYSHQTTTGRTLCHLIEVTVVVTGSSSYSIVVVLDTSM
ncbi:uncharacterized protein F4822DRAFT_418402 [Hypoxylon trugodes]|uniref:uncharacterized protein n=1 Tax=Hypoxylon trugodes TaxID=326681 RepID=UPI00219E2E1F|nr:uncharacterized protein F4822DRAFT_418402 [Hypoxylon trugodes]KAI1384027.1 hypothetical protein F4822DRAFT_418402 [Hypoxylon trugodes]